MPAADGIIARADDPKSHLAAVKNPVRRLQQRIFLWEKYAHAGQLADIAAREIDSASPLERVKLAALLCEAGHVGRALAVLEAALGENAEILQECRYLGLLAPALDRFPGLVQRYAAEGRAAEWHRANMGRFSRLVRNSSSIAVVGNSPVAAGGGAGEAIDSCEVVVRFNNYSLAPEFRADYGSKTDVWFRPPHYDWLWRRYGDEPSLSVYSRPIYYRFPEAHDVVLDDFDFGRRADEPPLRIFTDLRRLLKAPPSSGILALYWIWTLRGSLADVMAVGFSMTDQQGGQANHYFQQSHQQPASPHNWSAERALFDSISGAGT